MDNTQLRDSDGNTCLSWAARRGHASIVPLLLELEGVDINVRKEEGDTPLILAAENGCAEIIGILVDHPRIMINARNYLRLTPLSEPLRNQGKPSLKLTFKIFDQMIIQLKDVGARDRLQSTALLLAAEGAHVDAFKVYLRTWT